MKPKVTDFPPPQDAEQRKAIPPVVCYPVNQLKVVPLDLYFRLAESLEVPPRGVRNSSHSLLLDYSV